MYIWKKKKVSANRMREAEVHQDAIIGINTIVWNGSHLRENVRVGSNVVIGENVYIGPGVVVGNQTKIQNLCQIYDPAIIQDGVFLGPGTIITNDIYPRAVNADFTQKSKSDWKPQVAVIKKGASIGAGCICVAPIEIGEWSMIAAGSVIVSDVPAYALMAGIPARRINWVGRSGFPLIKISHNKFRCPVTGEEYIELDSQKLELV